MRFPFTLSKLNVHFHRKFNHTIELWKMPYLGNFYPNWNCSSQINSPLAYLINHNELTSKSLVKLLYEIVKNIIKQDLPLLKWKDLAWAKLLKWKGRPYQAEFSRLAQETVKAWGINIHIHGSRQEKMGHPIQQEN